MIEAKKTNSLWDLLQRDEFAGLVRRVNQMMGATNCIWELQERGHLTEEEVDSDISFLSQQMDSMRSSADFQRWQKTSGDLLGIK